MEFVVFCIGNIAEELDMKADKVFKLLTDNSNILNGYIIPCCDCLHTQGRDYIIEDMREEGVIETGI